MECCICYDKICKSHPRMCCCKQFIHTKCLRQCVVCPWCRGTFNRHPNTRSVVKLVTELAEVTRKTEEADKQKWTIAIISPNTNLKLIANYDRLNIVHPHIVREASERAKEKLEGNPPQRGNIVNLCRHRISHHQHVGTTERHNPRFFLVARV